MKGITEKNGHPFSELFDDIYYPQQDGLGAARHVFIQPNNVTERLRESKSFVVGELGFGTGLNFVAVLYEWLKTNQSCHLTFVSVEKYPLEPSVVEKTLRSFPEIMAASKLLLAVYRELPSGFHRLSIIPGKVDLLLLIGDGLQSLQDLDSQVDAWFLDGFNPRTNDDLWSHEIFSTMAALSYKDTTYSTWCSAGEVRRRLGNTGFTVEKIKGFDQKRESIRGQYQTDRSRRSLKIPQTATVIGGGIAGCSIASELALRGIETKILEQDTIASGASGNRLALVMPYLSRSESLFAQFYLSGFFAALNTIERLSTNGLLPSWHQCGAIQQIQGNKQKELINFLRQHSHSEQLPAFAHPSYIQAITEDEAISLSGMPLTGEALYSPLAGFLSPAQYCRGLLALGAQVITIREHCPVSALERSSCGWLIKDASGQVVQESEIVVVATAWATNHFSQLNWLSLGKTRGQLIDAWGGSVQSRKLETLLAYSGYCTPSYEGTHTLGVSYSRCDSTSVSSIEAEQIFENFKSTTKADESNQTDCKSRVSFRATTLDKLPVVGHVPTISSLNVAAHDSSDQTTNGLFVLTGLGSRAMISSQLCSAHLCSDIAGTTSPLPKSIKPLVSLERELNRSQKRKRTTS